jgi:hypothetical protein
MHQRKESGKHKVWLACGQLGTVIRTPKPEKPGSQDLR